MTSTNTTDGPRGARGLARLARLAACSLAACLICATISSGQPPKDPKKDPSKEQPKEQPKESPDEQKAKEAFLAGKLDDAIKALEAAKKTNPAIGPAKVIVARWCVETQQGQQARILIEQAAAEDPGHPEVLLTNGSFALAEGRITDTILSCTAALAACDNPRWDAEQKKRFQREARLGLVTGFEFRGDYTATKAHLLALLKTDAKNAQLRQRLARASFLLGLPDDAFNELEQAYKDDQTLDPPELAMAQLWATKTDSKTEERFANADQWYSKAVKKHESNAKVQRGFAGYLLDRGNIPLAKRHLDVAKKIEPAAKETKALEGIYLRYTKEYTKATEIFEELVKQNPAFSNYAANLALVLAEVGNDNDKRRAVELAETHAKQNQRSGEARAIWAYTLFKSGRLADAERAARSAFGLSYVTPDAAYFLVKILAEKSPVEDMQKIIKVACESKDPFVYRKEGEALLAELDKKMPKK